MSKLRNAAVLAGLTGASTLGFANGAGVWNFDQPTKKEEKDVKKD
jgi:hypothetical protein